MSKRLRVHELIERLQAMPQDAEVITEGCDCFGDAVDLELGMTCVLIRRDIVNDNNRMAGVWSDFPAPDTVQAPTTKAEGPK